MKNFNEVLSKTNLAFSKSPMKGVVFWYNILLPKSETNSRLNEKTWKDLQKTLIKQKPDQMALVNEAIDNLKYIREQVLKDDSARKKVEELKDFLVQAIVTEGIIDLTQEYVSTNYDSIKSDLGTTGNTTN